MAHYVKIRNIAYDEMVQCFPNAVASRSDWKDLIGTLYPIVVPLEPTMYTCYRGSELYATGEPKNRYGQAVVLCGHLADMANIVEIE